MRPTLTFDRTDDEQPFMLIVPEVDGDKVHAMVRLSRSEHRALRNDMDAAEQEDRQHTQCLGDHHVMVRADTQPLTPPGAVAVVCRNCPATGVLEPDGDIVPVQEDAQPCPTCSGKGIVPHTGEGRDGYDPCPTCNWPVPLLREDDDG